MMKTIFFGLILLFTISCTNDDNDGDIKKEKGEVWLSGGLAFCAEQIRLDNGDTLTTSRAELFSSFKSGERVNVKYKEIGINEFCPPFIDCEIIEIESIE